MNLSHQQVNEILEIFDRQLVIFTASTVGVEYLSEIERKKLELQGIDVGKLYDESKDIIKLNFQLGMLSQAIGEGSENITYDQLRHYLQSGQSIPLTSSEQASIDSIKRQSLSDIKTNQGKIFSDINNVVRQDSLEKRGQHEFIKQTVIEGLSKRETVRQISTKLASLTGDWSRNFNKSVQYISHTALNEGRLAMVERRGEGGRVYFQVQKDACKWCVKLYLTAGHGSEPRIFTAKELLANGSNIGRKQSQWKPSIEPIHVNCRCLLTEYHEGVKWSGTRFTIPKEQTYHSPIGRKKIRVVFNGQEFFV